MFNVASQFSFKLNPFFNHTAGSTNAAITSKRKGLWYLLQGFIVKFSDQIHGHLSSLLYQENVSRVAMALADFSPEEFEDLRNVLTKKRDWGRFAADRKLFEERTQKRGDTRQKLDEIWEMTESFRVYFFSKPHSASFSMVSYKSAYLKAHYPAEFMTSVISNQRGFYTPFACLSEAKGMGIRMLLPDINRSAFHSRAEHYETPLGDRKIPPNTAHPPRWRAIRVGLVQIKGLNKKTTQAILEERARRPLSVASGSSLAPSDPRGRWDPSHQGRCLRSP